MNTDKLRPNDPRVKWETSQIRGKTYHYMIGEPQGTPKDTMLLLHGWPDISFGWRYQVPYFLSLGFRVIVPDMIGFGRTDAPQDLKEYTFKSSAADMNELAIQYVGKNGQIVLGGHDWGGFLVWRIAEWYPQLIKCVFSVCTPYTPPSKIFTDLKDSIAAGYLRNFIYQLQLAGPDVEANIQSKEKLRQFFSTMYGGVSPDKKSAFNVGHGVFFDKLSKIEKPRFLSEDELEYYTNEYMRHETRPMRGGLNWYRTRKLNHEADMPLAKRGDQVKPPALFIAATRDSALPPSMSEGMEKSFRDLTRAEVESDHWALVQAAGQVNKIVSTWLDKVLGSPVKANM